MRPSIRLELYLHIAQYISDGVLTDDNKEDWHYHAFNENACITGEYKARDWLRTHDVDAFGAIAAIHEWEDGHMGERHADVSCAEKVVNMYVYILGEELLTEFNAADIAELQECVS